MFIHNRMQTARQMVGERAVVWVQDAALPALVLEFRDHAFVKDKDMSIGELADWILDQNIEGVTFSGGEPFQQRRHWSC